jgi:hypothetical protein
VYSLPMIADRDVDADHRLRVQRECGTAQQDPMLIWGA